MDCLNVPGAVYTLMSLIYNTNRRNSRIDLCSTPNPIRFGRFSLSNQFRPVKYNLNR